MAGCCDPKGTHLRKEALLQAPQHAEFACAAEQVASLPVSRGACTPGLQTLNKCDVVLTIEFVPRLPACIQQQSNTKIATNGRDPLVLIANFNEFLDLPCRKRSLVNLHTLQERFFPRGQVRIREKHLRHGTGAGRVAPRRNQHRRVRR